MSAGLLSPGDEAPPASGELQLTLKIRSASLGPSVSLCKRSCSVTSVPQAPMLAYNRVMETATGEQQRDRGLVPLQTTSACCSWRWGSAAHASAGSRGSTGLQRRHLMLLQGMWWVFFLS